ncbi:hypothetical protein SDC9_123586 [bioreactor metagenome]|uniref:Uncharacterized protein n=1 Tax=bioreactor metagenome TaxID=1076179 RepID=A0A645CI23_9ZZZZ
MVTSAPGGARGTDAVGGSPDRTQSLSVQDGGELPDLLHPGTPIGRQGRSVEVVDVQRHDRPAPTGLPDHRGHRRGRDPPTPLVGGDPYPLHLADARGRRADVGLEDHPTALDDRVRPALLDQRPDVDPVGHVRPADGRRLTDLLGVHRHSSIGVRLPQVEGRRPDPGVRRDRGLVVDEHHRLVGPDVTRLGPLGAPLAHQLVVERHRRLGRADDRRGDPAVAGERGERRTGPGIGVHRHHVGPGVQHRPQPAALLITPDRAAQGDPVQPAGPDPGSDVHVVHRVTPQQRQRSGQVVGAERTDTEARGG